MNKNSMGYTIVFIFIVSFAFVFLLSLTNMVTIDQIEANQELARKQAVLTAMGIEYRGEADVRDKYEQIRGNVEEGLYVYESPDRTVWAKRFVGAGLWGSIQGVLAVTSDLERIVGIEIVDQNETPGLGGRITEPWFKEQFRNEKIPADAFEVTEGDGDDNPDNGEVDGITGATRTSDSIEKIVRDEIDALQAEETQERFREIESEGGTT
jgi:Na+-transporting NADH:ubiquinone oxidoreductase subunit C